VQSGADTYLVWPSDQPSSLRPFTRLWYAHWESDRWGTPKPLLTQARFYWAPPDHATFRVGSAAVLVAAAEIEGKNSIASVWFHGDSVSIRTVQARSPFLIDAVTIGYHDGEPAVFYADESLASRVKYSIWSHPLRMAGHVVPTQVDSAQYDIVMGLSPVRHRDINGIAALVQPTEGGTMFSIFSRLDGAWRSASLPLEDWDTGYLSAIDVDQGETIVSIWRSVGAPVLGAAVRGAGEPILFEMLDSRAMSSVPIVVSRDQHSHQIMWSELEGPLARLGVGRPKSVLASQNLDCRS
jgi:hypothetical protein